MVQPAAVVELSALGMLKPLVAHILLTITAGATAPRSNITIGDANV
jgi:hypothetical protein